MSDAPIQEKKSDRQNGSEKSWFAYAATAGTSELAEEAPVLFRGDFYHSIDQAAQLGFDALELHVRSAADIDTDKLKEHCARQHVRISALATGMAYTVDQLSLIAEGKEDRQKAIERLMQMIDVASELECIVIIGYMRGNIPDALHYESCEQLLLDSVRQLVLHAEKRNVMLVVEAINQKEVNYLNTVRETTDFVKRISSPLLKVHIDTFHMDQEETDIEQSIAYCGEYIGYVHYVDRHRRIPGEGVIDFGRVTQALIQTGYRGTISLEYPPYGDAMRSARKGLAFVKMIERQCKSNLQHDQIQK